MSEHFKIMADPGNPRNWGVVWETSGTEAGYASESAARQGALKQGGTEADSETTKTWEW